MDDPTSLIDRANDLSSRYEELHKIEDLEESISLQREALMMTLPVHPDRHTAVFNLAYDLGHRFEKLGRLEDLEESISLDRNALALRPAGHTDRSSSLSNLAGGLYTRYKRLGKMEDLEESISLNRSTLALCPVGHPDRSLSLSNLAIGLHTRYGQLGKMDDLEESISLDRSALALHPVGHLDQSWSLNNLASGLGTQYKQSGKMEHLEECISLNRSALALYPVGHPDRSLSLSNLAIGLRNRYEQLGKMDDLEESIFLHRDALALRPVGHPDQSSSLSSLASDLCTQYKKSGKMEDLEESISLNRSALALRTVGHPDRSSSLSSLASGLGTQYELSGKMEDLEECISLNRSALALCPVGHPDRALSLSNLAIGLRKRYEQLGKMDDLEESIFLYRDGLALRPVGHPDQSSSLSNLAVGLYTRYKRLGKMEDLEECISLNRSALALCTVGHPLRSLSLNNLATGLRNRYEQLGKMDDLEESIFLHRDALALRPVGHPDRSSSLSRLAIGLDTKYKKFGKKEDLEESISLHRNALALRPTGHPLRSLSLTNLAFCLRSCYDQSANIETIQEMYLTYKQAAGDSSSYLKDRLEASVQWAYDARDHQHQSTLSAYSTALELLQRSLISRPDVQEQHGYLATSPIGTGSLASDAASAAIHAGNLHLAVEFLEQGRAMLWSKIDAYKYPLEQLRQVQGGGELADEFERLSAELERLVLLSDRNITLEEGISADALSFDAQVTRHRILSEDWDKVVGRIRTMPGFAYFLQTPPFDSLRVAAAEGPVIFINISKYRSDAIIVTLNKSPILVPLPTIDPGILRQQADRLTTNRGIISVLRYLWEYIVSPVVDRLTELGVQPKSHIWWCPTADLCALPLHAAGPYRRHEENLQDLYTSSYASTLSSLIRARSNIQISRAPKLLVVGQPHETLQKVQEEVGIIKEYGGTINLLLGAEASHETVLDNLHQHSWVHFACHGHLGDNGQPFQASFELSNGRRLSLLDLIQARLPNAECAFLAACHTAAGDSRTPDENIHLSAALQFCGFRSVIGTLWEMFDDDGPMISKEFYNYMFRNPDSIDFRDSAYALNSAIRAMRKANLPPERWVMFVHIGA